ncbi:hypothetical protein [Streptomyces sp. MMBL 11-3]|uniref:hypothetical protein n=1 Tax=Streptomyces sp. MMBL 11-3 TaxID=3382639 RepID=UPI0039B394CB
MASLTDTETTEIPAGRMDVRAGFQAVLDARDELVPSTNGTAQDLVAEPDAYLATLQGAFAEAVTLFAPAKPSPVTAPAKTTAEEVVATPVPQQTPAVNSALQQADAHTAALRGPRSGRRSRRCVVRSATCSPSCGSGPGSASSA